LLIILALLVLLFALFLPAAVKVRQAAARTQCHNNLRQLVIGLHNMHDVYGAMPPLAGPFPANSPSHGTLFFYMLPFIEQDNLYKNAHGQEGGQAGYFVWINETNRHRIPTFVCPQDPSNKDSELFHGWLATSTYAANAQVFAKADPQTGEVSSLDNYPKIPTSFPDGTSNTIAFSERYQMCGEDACAWGYYGDYYWVPAFVRYNAAKFQTTPDPKACNPTLAQSPHPGGINVALADGSSRSVNSKISEATWWYACTPAGGEVLGSDW
jgi:prepilin-type processing-associated H-X9-DG protein